MLSTYSINGVSAKFAGNFFVEQSNHNCSKREAHRGGKVDKRQRERKLELDVIYRWMDRLVLQCVKIKPNMTFGKEHMLAYSTRSK